MRSFGLGLTLALCTLGYAQDKLKLEPVIKDDDTAKHSLEVDYDFGGTKARLTSRVITKVKKQSPTAIAMTLDYEDLKVVVDENELPLQITQIEFSLAPNGDLKEITGGVDGNDNARSYLLMMFINPDKELAVNEKWTYESKGNEKSSIPGYKYEATYLGPEKVGPDDAFKYSTKLTETSGSLGTKGTFWVTKAGKVVKAESEFTGLMIPAAGAEASGKVRLAIVKS